MKKILFTLGLIAVSFGVFAQENTSGSAVSGVANRARYSRDFLMIQLTYDNWAGADSARVTGFSRGFNVYLMYDFPINNSHYSFAPGLGIGTSSIFLDDQKIDMSNGNSQQVNYVNTTAFSKYKVMTTYVDIPLELRYRGVPDNANKGFKAALGVKVGALLNAHTKSKSSLGGEKNILKEQNKRFFNTWRYAGTARIGWGNWAVLGTYSFSSVFKNNTGQEAFPYSIGLCLSGL
ncbi:porin family protein [uncultured Chitinophaga sp.]|uniref:porin family protein n=1 Tax=uncultured Chitinophaga sp. TaxID=339340 RepID=UPI0025EC77C6|nr:porin family protein [uncultured Chitinophaga sp.]